MEKSWLCWMEKSWEILDREMRVKKKDQNVGIRKSSEGEKKRVEWSKRLRLEKENMRYGIR